jgi:hypothetical protein
MKIEVYRMRCSDKWRTIKCAQGWRRRKVTEQSYIYDNRKLRGKLNYDRGLKIESKMVIHKIFCPYLADRNMRECRTIWWTQ